MYPLCYNHPSRTNLSIQLLCCLPLPHSFTIQKHNSSNPCVFNQFCALFHSSPASPLFASLTQNNPGCIPRATRRGSRQEPPESRQGLPAADYALGAKGVRFRGIRLPARPQLRRLVDRVGKLGGRAHREGTSCGGALVVGRGGTRGRARRETFAAQRRSPGSMPLWRAMSSRASI